MLNVRCDKNQQNNTENYNICTSSYVAIKANCPAEEKAVWRFIWFCKLDGRAIISSPVSLNFDGAIHNYIYYWDVKMYLMDDSAWMATPEDKLSVRQYGLWSQIEPIQESNLLLLPRVRRQKRQMLWYLDCGCFLYCSSHSLLMMSPQFVRNCVQSSPLHPSGRQKNAFSFS